MGMKLNITTTKEKLLDGLSEITSKGGTVTGLDKLAGVVNIKGVKATYSYSEALGTVAIVIVDQPLLASDSYIEQEITKFFKVAKEYDSNPKRIFTDYTAPTKTKPKKNAMVIYAFIVVIFAAMSYLAGSFSQADFNIAEWDEDTRNFVAVFFGFMACFIGPMVAVN